MSSIAWSRAVVASAAVVLGLSLGACGGDDSSETAEALANTSTNSQGATSDSGSGDVDRPDNLSDFPLPDDYTVVTSGSRDGAWTAVLTTSTDWEELMTRYKQELPSSGWTINGEHPTAAEQGAQIDATRDDMEATVAVSSVDGETSVMINVAKQ